MKEERNMRIRMKRKEEREARRKREEKNVGEGEGVKKNGWWGINRSRGEEGEEGG